MRKLKFYIIILGTIPSFLITFALSNDLDTKTYQIASKLMCPVCRGQTVADSNSELANDMRRIIKNKLKKGETEEQIIAYFRARYGDSVLASPPKKGVNLLLWGLPLGLLLVGTIFLINFLTNVQRSSRTPQKKENTQKDIAQKKDIIQKIEKELEPD